MHVRNTTDAMFEKVATPTSLQALSGQWPDEL